MVLCRRCRSKRPEIDEATTMPSSSPPLHEGTDNVEISNELEGNEREPSEVDGSRDRKEMPSSTQRLRDTSLLQPPSELP